MIGLPPIDAAPRGAALDAKMSEADIDAFVVTEPTSIRWLCGFTGSNGLVVARTAAHPAGQGLVLITDGRYRDQAAAEMEAVGVQGSVVITRESEKKAVETTVPARRIGVDPDHVTWGRVRTLRSLLAEHAPDSELVAVSGLFSTLRLVKDVAELARMQAAADCADAAMSRIVPSLVPGTTERQLASALDAAMRDVGASGPAFDTIVAAGANGARPHHRPDDTEFTAGDLVVIDVGAVVDGYRSDMTRTVGIGSIDADRARIWSLVLEAQSAGVEAVRAGGAVAAVDEACRTIIADAGFGDAFMHGTGHGVGLDIHEAPLVNGKASGRLVANQAITVEPGIYLSNLGGVRIEDLVQVRTDGRYRLTRSPISLDPESLRSNP